MSSDTDPKQTQSKAEAAIAAIDEQQLLDIATELTSIASPLGDDQILAEALDARIRALGLSSSLQPFAPNQSNVLASLNGGGDRPRLMFVTNLENDFAPTATRVPTPRVEDGWLHGCGIWNMKGTYAASLAAAIAVRDAGIELDGGVLVAGVAAMMDEAPVDTRIEGDSRPGYGAGTKHLLGEGHVADLAVVGTPTSFRIMKRHLGQTAFRIDLQGPPLIDREIDELTGDLEFLRVAAGVIEPAAEVVAALREWAPGYQRRAALDGVGAWVRVTGIEGGRPWSPVPADQASIFVFVGSAPGAGPAVFAEIDEALAGVRGAYPDVEFKVSQFSDNPGPSVPDDSPVVTALEAAHRDVFDADPESAVAVWHSDASPLVVHGVPAVNYGVPGKLWPAGDIPGEAVRVADLVDCARVFASLIARVCAA